LHSLTEKTDKFSKVEYKTPAYIKVNDNNKNNYSCNVNKSSAILNQDEIVVNIKNKKNELNQKTVIKNSPKKKLVNKNILNQYFIQEHFLIIYIFIYKVFS